MVWTAPQTAVAGQFTAALFNTHIRDNLNMLAPALATTVGGYFVSTAANTLAQRTRGQSSITAEDSTASTTYVNLPGGSGPAVTATTGTKVIVGLSFIGRNSGTGVNNRQWMSVAVSGATTTAASDVRACMMTQNAADQSQRSGTWTMMTVTAGSNTFTGQYRVTAGTGTFSSRNIIVIPL